MSPLRVPAAFVGSFEQLHNADDATFNAFVAALTSATPPIRPDALAKQIAAKVDELSEEDVAPLLGALTSLLGLRRIQSLSMAEVAAQLVASPDLTIEEDAREKFAGRVTAALETRAVRLMGKAIDLGSEHDKVFIGARVLTDMRPIFGDDVDEQPEGGVIAHTLKLEYVHDEGMIGNVYVTLDAKDLVAVKDALDRADKKARTLKALIERADLPYLGPEG